MDIFPSEPIKEYDDNNKNIVYSENYDYKKWYKYDDRGNEIYLKQLNIFGTYYEEWRKFDKSNREIYYRDTRYFLEGEWYKYDEKGNQTEITQQEFKQIERTRERRKLLLNNKKCSRFEIIDI